MNRITQLEPARATGRTQELFATVEARLGAVPNLFRVLANSTAALVAFLKFGEALGDGVLTPGVRQQIALAVAESNLCGYCLSAHCTLGAKTGLNAREIADARRAAAGDAKTDAILKLAQAIVVHRGEISDADLRAAKAAGLGDSEIVETVANVALNIFSNYVNHVAGTVIDFPEVQVGGSEPLPAGHAAA